MLCNDDLAGLRTAKRLDALQFFSDHPNETAEGVVTGPVLAQMSELGLIIQHADDRARKLPLVWSSWMLSEIGEKALALWKVQ